MNMYSAATTAARNGAGRYPVTWSIDPANPACDSAAKPDYVAYNTGLVGSATTASIVAYDNLYKTTCAGPGPIPIAVPLVYWQYNITAGTISGSPVASLDGTQLAFVNVVGGVADLVLLKWAKNSSLVTLTSTAAASYRACAAPCMTSIAFNGNPTSTGSSPFVDYNTDSIYVGDNSGKLHKFVNVFNGTPAEITVATAVAGWPLTISAGAALPSPIFDAVSGNAFIGAGDGKAYRVPAAGGTANVVASAMVTTGCGYSSPPVVDITAGSAYFSLIDLSSTTAGTCGGTLNGGPAVVQYSTTFAANAAPIAKISFGQGTTGVLAVTPAVFDNDYFNSPNPASPNGKLFTCFNTSTGPRLIQFNIVNNVLSTLVQGPLLASSATPACGQVTEFSNGVADYLFTGVASGPATGGAAYNCIGGPSTIGNGCIAVYNIAAPFNLTTSTTPVSVLQVTGGGPSGISVDNKSTVTGASQVYFQTVEPQACAGNGTTGFGVGFCAVQASQSGLQ